MISFSDNLHKVTVEQFKEWAADKGIELTKELNGFKVGQSVTYTNDYGVIFKNRIIVGIAKYNQFPNNPKKDSHIFFEESAWWFPSKLTSIK